MTPTKRMDLPCGGHLEYRLPNCLEQIRFYVDSKWNSKELLLEQVEAAIPFLSKFIISVESEKHKDFDSIIADRSNVNQFIEFALDIGNQTLDDTKKKS